MTFHCCTISYIWVIFLSVLSQNNCIFLILFIHTFMIMCVLAHQFCLILLFPCILVVSCSLYACNNVTELDLNQIEHYFHSTPVQGHFHNELSWRNNVIWHRKTRKKWPSLVLVVAYHLFNSKPLPEPMLTYCQLYHKENFLNKFILENAFEIVVRKTLAILFRPTYVCSLGADSIVDVVCPQSCKSWHSRHET